MTAKKTKLINIGDKNYVRLCDLEAGTFLKDDTLSLILKRSVRGVWAIKRNVFQTAAVFNFRDDRLNETHKVMLVKKPEDDREMVKQLDAYCRINYRKAVFHDGAVFKFENELS